MTNFLQQKPSLSQCVEARRGCMSSLAADPPAEDLNSMPESTEKSVGCDNQGPT